MYFVMDCITFSLGCYVIATRCHKAFFTGAGHWSYGHFSAHLIKYPVTKAGSYL